METDIVQVQLQTTTQFIHYNEERSRRKLHLLSINVDAQ